MQKRLQKGIYGYLNKNKIYAWKKAVLMLAVPVIIFLVAWAVHKTRENVMTVVAIVGCLPGCNQVVRAIMASRYHSIEEELYQEVEKAKGTCVVLYENVFTAYERTYYIDALVVLGREIVGYTSVTETDTKKAAEHIRELLKKNAYKQNVRIFPAGERKAYLERVRKIADVTPEEVPFKGDERYPGFTREEIVVHLIRAISL